MSFFQKFITRKFVAATLTSGLLAICWVLCEWLTKAKENYGTLATSLVGALSAYTVGNVVQDHVLSKTAAGVQKAAEFVLPQAQPKPIKKDE
jgi:hypothetical protein